MSNYPESADIFTDKAPNDGIGSSDPNVAYDAIEASQGLIGTLGKPQSWSTTLITLLRKYREGMEIELDGANLYVRKGEAMLENTDGTKLACRRNATDVLLSSANIDTGALAINTYYIYASAGAAMTTAPILFSLDVNAPSGIGTAPYRQLGYFWNEAVGALAVTYISGGDAPIKREKVYDSRWISVVSNTTYPLTHNLGTTKFLSGLYYSTDGNDDNASLINVALNAQGTSTIKNITTTTLTLQTSTDVALTISDNGTIVEHTTGYVKVVLLSLN